MAPQKIKVTEHFSGGEIDLSMSELEEVPVQEIALLKKAPVLDLSNNNITRLPKNFAILTHLTKLDLSKNRLTELPDNFGDLIRLRHLDLYQNEIQHLPLSFSKLKVLKWLDLKDNPLVPVVAKVAGQCLDTKQCQKCAKDVVNFFTQLQEKVDNEKEVRQKQRQKPVEVKQKKAKAKEKKQQINGVIKEAKKHKNKKKAKVAEVVPEKKTNLFVKYLYYFAFWFLFLFVLTSFKWKFTRNLEGNVRNLLGTVVNYLPVNCKSYAVKFGLFLDDLHGKTGKGLNELLNYVRNSQIFHTFYANLCDITVKITGKVEQFYSSLL